MSAAPTPELDALAKEAFRVFGLHIEPSKYGVVTSRLPKLFSQTSCANLSEVVAMLRGGDQRRILAAFDVLSTNHTHFFRESHHLDLLREEFYGPGCSVAQNPLRIWSAGCSNGCEPYSIAITAAEALQSVSPLGFRMLATDLAISELRWAKRGSYTRRHLDSMPKDVVERYFSSENGPEGELFSVRSELRAPIRFALLNLLEAWPMKGPFDAIFCRNVLIYFDQPTRDKIVSRFMALLRPNGLLFLGTSEGISGRFPQLDSIGPSAYRRIA